MNMQPAHGLFGLPAAAPALRAPKKRRYSPRDEILDQVVTGLLWMSINLPEDVSLAELNKLAHRLVCRIRANVSPAILEEEIAVLQSDHFGRRADHAAIRMLVRRCVRSVKGW